MFSLCSPRRGEARDETSPLRCVVLRFSSSVCLSQVGEQLEELAHKNATECRKAVEAAQEAIRAEEGANGEGSGGSGEEQGRDRVVGLPPVRVREEPLSSCCQAHPRASGCPQAAASAPILTPLSL